MPSGVGREGGGGLRNMLRWPWVRLAETRSAWQDSRCHMGRGGGGGGGVSGPHAVSFSGSICGVRERRKGGGARMKG